MMGDDRRLIRCAIDINPQKQGGFLPGSGIPILSPERAAADGVEVAIVLNPNYFDEVRAHCEGNGIGLALLTL